jgi:hypothetical protein
MDTRNTERVSAARIATRRKSVGSSFSFGKSGIGPLERFSWFSDVSLSRGSGGMIIFLSSIDSDIVGMGYGRTSSR